MKLKEVRDILNAEVLFGEELLDTEVRSACGSDLTAPERLVLFLRRKKKQKEQTRCVNSC